MTIKEAIIETLRRAGIPLSAKDIYGKLREFDLYRFNTEQPEHVVYTQIRRHCEGIDFSNGETDKVLSSIERWALLDKRHTSSRSNNRIREGREQYKARCLKC